MNKKEQIKYFNTLLQPYRNGVLSKEFIEAYGSKSLNLKKGEYRKARYVWRSLAGWKDRAKSK